MKKTNNKTHIAMVIDRSGSMANIRDDTIGGINTFLDEQRKEPEGTRITYVQFDDVYEVVYDNVEVQYVPRITRETFVPRSMTALLDGIGKTVNRTASYIAAQAPEDRPNKVLFVIVTDGHENASREFTREAVFELINSKQNNEDWQFVFLAANQDAIATAQTYGIRGTSAMNYSAGKVGVANVFIAASNKAMDFKRGTIASVDFDARERYCSTADSASAQDAALQQYANAVGKTLEEVKQEALSGGQGGATVVSSTTESGTTTKSS